MVKKGDRIELVHTSDKYTKLEPGDQGEVTSVDSIGTIHVKWDNGSTLGLVPGEDEFKVVEKVDDNDDEGDSFTPPNYGSTKPHMIRDARGRRRPPR